VVQSHSVQEDTPGFSGTAVCVRPFAAGEEKAWDDFVLSHSHGSPFHLMAWKKTISEVFGYIPKYLVAEQSGRIRGVLPLFLVQNLLVKKALISSPFAVYGGVLSDGPEVHKAFRDALEQLGRSLGVQYIELRNQYPEQRLGFAPIQTYVSFVQSIGPDEAGLLEAIPRKTRAMVRKSLNAGFVTRRLETASPGFLDVYARSLRRLGTPCFPLHYFDQLMHNFKGSVDVREVTSDGSVGAAVLTFYFRDQVIPYYGASHPSWNARAPNNFMYFDLMRSTAKEGYRIFDFGRSKKHGSTSYDFKSHWGMTERELPYEILLVKRKEAPNFTPNNRAYQWPLAMWRRLPLPVTKFLGPFFIRLVP